MTITVPEWLLVVACVCAVPYACAGLYFYAQGQLCSRKIRNAILSRERGRG